MRPSRHRRFLRRRDFGIDQRGLAQVWNGDSRNDRGCNDSTSQRIHRAISDRLHSDDLYLLDHFPDPRASADERNAGRPTRDRKGAAMDDDGTAMEMMNNWKDEGSQPPPVPQADAADARLRTPPA